jgi:hypothetical protein
MSKYVIAISILLKNAYSLIYIKGTWLLKESLNKELWSIFPEVPTKTITSHFKSLNI